MKRNRERKRIYRSIGEVEKEFFPKSFEKRMAKKPTDAQALGVNLAKESLETVRGELVK